jgi:hypothetical protein
VAALARPRWLPEVVRDWANANSGSPVKRMGRPRTIR